MVRFSNGTGTTEIGCDLSHLFLQSLVTFTHACEFDAVLSSASVNFKPECSRSDPGADRYRRSNPSGKLAVRSGRHGAKFPLAPSIAFFPHGGGYLGILLGSLGCVERWPQGLFVLDENSARMGKLC